MVEWAAIPRLSTNYASFGVIETWYAKMPDEPSRRTSKTSPSLYSCPAYWALDMVLEKPCLFLRNTMLSAHLYRHMHEGPNCCVILHFGNLPGLSA